MNKKFEQWLTIVALGSWVASMGALVAIEVASTQPLSDQSLPLESQVTRLQLRGSSQFAAVLDSPFYQQIKQADTWAILEPDRGHWLDRTLVTHDLLTQDFFKLDLDGQTLGSRSQKLSVDPKPETVGLLAQTSEAWQDHSLHK